MFDKLPVTAFSKNVRQQGDFPVCTNGRLAPSGVDIGDDLGGPDILGPKIAERQAQITQRFAVADLGIVRFLGYFLEFVALENVKHRYNVLFLEVAVPFFEELNLGPRLENMPFRPIVGPDIDSLSELAPMPIDSRGQNKKRQSPASHLNVRVRVRQYRQDGVESVNRFKFQGVLIADAVIAAIMATEDSIACRGFGDFVENFPAFWASIIQGHQELERRRVLFVVRQELVDGLGFL